MIFLDSWVWIELFSRDERWKKAEAVVDKLDEEQGIISPTVLMEVRYRVKRKFGEARADRVTTAILSIENLDVLPVTTRVGLHAADLRDKYYQNGTLEMSYGDAIHLATADLAGCDALYTGDPDFEDVDEVETVVI